jgi:hypothetical protein
MLRLEAAGSQRRAPHTEKQLKALEDHLTRLSARAEKARGQARKRLKRLERRTRAKIKHTVRALEPTVRQAVAEAAVIVRGVAGGCPRGGPCGLVWHEVRP